MPGARGMVIFLNGTSGAGKTTLAAAIQEASDVPYLHAGFDAYFAMVPPKWGGGRGGPLSAEGFRYETSTDTDGRPRTVITYGDVGRRMLFAMHRSAAALTSAGTNVIIDEMLLSEEMLDDWLRVLEGIDVLFVGVHCDLKVLEQREAVREHGVPGLARGHLDLVHAHKVYDLEVDTTRASASHLAGIVLRRRHEGPPPTALDMLRQQRRRAPVAEHGGITGWDDEPSTRDGGRATGAGRECR